MRVARRCLVMEKNPVPSCHASTVLRLPNGEVLAAWFGGSAEGADDVGIYLARGREGAFVPPKRVAGGGEPHWNPVLFQMDEERLFLFYKVGREIAAWRTMACVSSDGGHTFSPPRELVPGDAGGRGPVRGKPIRLLDGAVLAPASREDGFWRAFADRTEDGGATWQRSNDIVVPALAKQPRRGVIQPALWESAPGHVHALLRSTEGCIYRADSADGGRSFTDAYPTDLPNNNSGIDVAKLADGSLLLACNPVSGNWAARTPLTLFRSRDNGVRWVKQLDLETEAGEYSYPALVADGAGALMTYTHRRENIAYAEIVI